MSEYSRRRFLHDSVLAAAAAAASGPVSHLLAAENSAAIASKGPNEKLGVLVCGVHDRGKSHLDGFQGNDKLNTEVVAICDADKNVGEHACKTVADKQKGREPKYYQDIREALEDKAVDCVSIAMPNHWHALAAIWAMEHGKDVYVEKPVCHNIWEGQQMVATARNLGKICQTGTQCRSNAANIEAMEYMKSGAIGDVNLAHGLCYKGRPSIGPKGEYEVPSNIDYNLWRGPAPMAETSPYRGVIKEAVNGGKPTPVHYDWHWNFLFGNGDLGNQGIHQMDVARWGLGVNTLPNGVITYGGRFGYEDAGNTPNTEVVVLDYGPKTLVFETRGLKTDKFHEAGVGNIFYGTNGYVVMTGYTDGFAADKDWKKIKEFKGGGNHFANFISAVRSRNHEDLHADIQEGFLSSSLCHLGNISYRLGEKLSTKDTAAKLAAVKSSDDTQDTLDRTVDHLAKNGVKLDEAGVEFQCGDYLKFDPVVVNFPGNAKANDMLKREYRNGFEVKEARKA